MSKILVIGANGTVGKVLTKLLKQKKHEVFEATSRKANHPGQVQMNLLTGEGREAAFRGVNKAFLLSPPGHVNQDELLKPLVDEAMKADVQKVVLMTAMGADASESTPFRKAELHLIQSGLPYNIIRPNWFMQNFHTYWLAGIQNAGKILLPAGKAKGSFIDARDIAAVAAELLDTNRFDNQEFDLTGNEALDHDEVAVILRETTGRDICYQEISTAEMRKNLLAAGLPAPYTEFLLVILGFFKEGYSARITNSVQSITRREPISFEHYARDHRTAWLAP